MRRYILGYEAAQDVSDIGEHIAEGNIDAADRLVDTFFEAFDKLADMPGHWGTPQRASGLKSSP